LASRTARDFQAPPDLAFEALRKAITASGFELQGADTRARTVYFKSGRTSMSGSVGAISGGASRVSLVGATRGLYDRVATELESLLSEARARESAASTQVARATDLAADLERLGDLRERGLLTDEEFADAKARAFAQQPEPTPAPEPRSVPSEPAAPVPHPAAPRPTAGTPSTGDEGGFVALVTRYWQRRSKRGKIVTVVVAAVVGLALLGAALAPTDDEAASTTTTTTTPETNAKTAAEEAPAESESSDTGRMSDTEFEQFSAAQSEVVDESLQFSEEVQRCAVIGLAGQIAEYSTCMDDAHSGFREDAEYAYFIADDTLGDVAKQCRVVLRNYMAALDNLTTRVDAVHEAGSLLRFDDLTAASQALPSSARRYSRVAINALAACSPS
jgi:hypothetical protein